jgi:AAA domain-containing protein
VQLQYAIRQVGKTTLARQVVSSARGRSHRFDLEDDADPARLANPTLRLSAPGGLVVLDEVQGPIASATSPPSAKADAPPYGVISTIAFGRTAP